MSASRALALAPGPVTTAELLCRVEALPPAPRGWTWDAGALRAFLGRLIGWQDKHAVELAANSVTLAAAGCTTLVLCGDGDLVPIARALHRRVREPGRPFVVADPRRGDRPASVRSPANRGNAFEALESARAGTFVLRLRRPPTDLSEVVPLLRAADDAMLVICAAPHLASDTLLIRPAPVVVPPLASRAHELDRIIDEYAADAVADLGAPDGAFSGDDRAWVRQHAATSLDEIEKATLRLVALRTSLNMTQAAARLGVELVSLARWFARRGALALVLLLALLSTTAVHADCPTDGDGGDRDLNALKNRTDRPAKPTAMDVGQLLALKGPATRSPRARWTAAQRRAIADVEGAGVVVVGYLLGAKQEGPESANCHGADQDERDVHVWLAAAPGDPRSRAVVVEITPRQHDPHWTLAALRELARQHTQVRITGWLLYVADRRRHVHDDDHDTTTKEMNMHDNRDHDHDDTEATLHLFDAHQKRIEAPLEGSVRQAGAAELRARRHRLARRPLQHWRGGRPGHRRRHRRRPLTHSIRGGVLGHRRQGHADDLPRRAAPARHRAARVHLARPAGFQRGRSPGIALNCASSARGAARATRAFFARSEGGVRTTTHDAGGIMATIEQPTLDAKAPQAHEAAEIASLRIQLEAAHERIAELCDRSGPEYLVQRDLELAAWLATAATTHPELDNPTAPLAWPAAARAQLEGLISKYRGGDLPSGQPPRAEQLRIAAAIHDLCEANDCGVESTAAEIADAIVLDDDREWRRRYMVEVH